MKVAIIGLGLLGSSLAMALRGRGDYEIYGYARRQSVVDWALANQVTDFASTEPEEVIREADLTVIALPIPQIIAFMRQHRAGFKAGSVVTDIGSIKGDICRAALDCFQDSGITFVGSHPM
ncbi:MAG: prephenate dehydrogenase/arogenate dehydrogenase family protein, partial [Victivallaceae bacterium]